MSRTFDFSSPPRVADAGGGMKLGLGVSISSVRPIGGGTPAPTPSVTLSAAQQQPEGNSGATTFAYTVTRSTGTGSANVPWSFTAGGTQAVDFVGDAYPTGGTVALAQGATSGTFSINVKGETTVEGEEAFTVSIAVPSGYAAGASMSATGTILNDDAPASTAIYLTADNGDRLVDEAGNPLTMETGNG